MATDETALKLEEEKALNARLASLLERFCQEIIEDPFGVGIEITNLQWLKGEARALLRKTNERNQETTGLNDTFIKAKG